MIGRKKPGDLVSSSQSTEPKKRYRESARQTSKTMGEPCDASMRSNRRRERLQQREQEEALESVRSLNEWRANSEPSLRTTPPPTDRLYLDLDTRNIGHGKTEEQKQALRKQKEERATREAKRHQVIVSNIKRLEELEGDERDKLNTQLKVLDRLSPRCKGANDAANKMLSLFRKCSPDEFGFVRKRNFLHEMRRNYGLDHPEAERLFRIASDNGDEITYKQFRNAFSRIDKSTTFIPESYRPILKRDPDEQAHREAPPSPQPVAPKSFQSMTHAEREAHRQRSRILNALESSHVKMQARFRQAEEEPGGANIRVRTKLTFPEVAQVLNEFGVEVSADALTNLYGAKDSSEPQELTFSQLHRRTADYFAQLEAGDAAVGDDHRSMELKGQYLGCRRMLKPLEDAEKARKKSGAASEAATSNQHADHTSDAALPKDDRQENDKEGARRRRRRRRRRRHSALPTVSETMAQIRNPTREEDNIWKAHWTDKTIPKTDRTPGIRITDTGRRMQRGNGDILRWESDSLEPHPLETYRELDTGRSTLSSASFYSDFY